jgi:hypothetical protein
MPAQWDSIRTAVLLYDNQHIYVEAQPKPAKLTDESKVCQHQTGLRGPAAIEFSGQLFFTTVLTSCAEINAAAAAASTTPPEGRMRLTA